MMRQFHLVKANHNIRMIKAIDLMVNNSNQWVILFHGYGADAYDLQSLAEVLKPPQECNWLFPQGILEVPIGPGWTGRAWWNIDIAALERRNLDPGGADLSKEAPTGLSVARSVAMQMIEQLNVPWKNIILGGFSQGAMLATDLFLHAPENPRGLVLLSGALINKAEWQTKIAARKSCPFFIAHGKNDMVLPYRSAQQLEGFLSSAGLKGRLYSFDGGHEIPPEVILKANEYLKTLS